MGEDYANVPQPSDLSNLNDQEEARVDDYQDSLESKSKTTTPQGDDRRNDYDDDCKYDPMDLHHKQYFMPQAYPPASSKSKQQVQNSRSAPNQVKELTPHLSKQSLEYPTQSAEALFHSSPNKYVDPAVSFRQQTFDKGFFVKAVDENIDSRPSDRSLTKGHQRRPSAEALHQRSISLQDRIGDLEQMLKARIAE